MTVDPGLGTANTGRPKTTTSRTVAVSPSPSAGGITVAVYDGTRQSGLTSRVARTLARHGFKVTRTGNAGDQNHAATFVQYGATLKSQAQKVPQLSLAPSSGKSPDRASTWSWDRATPRPPCPSHARPPRWPPTPAPPTTTSAQTSPTDSQ
ncbi:LytR C-terminal domain-containing protein [Streptomyces mirabilis]|nr:LytR C-terminal domain-containing protein [Streptomyces mirabilis]